jgi:hypothetical protein
VPSESGSSGRKSLPAKYKAGERDVDFRAGNVNFGGVDRPLKRYGAQYRCCAELLSTKLPMSEWRRATAYLCNTCTRHLFRAARPEFRNLLLGHTAKHGGKW